MNKVALYTIGALIVIAGLMYLYIAHLENKVEQGKEFAGLYKSSLQENKVWKDKHDQWHSKAQDLAVSNSTLKEMIKAKDPDLVRLLSEVRELKKNLSNLQSFNTVATHTETRFNVKFKDTTIIRGSATWTAKGFDYKTNWDHYTGLLINDSLTLTRDGIDSLDIAAYFTRKWFFGKKVYSSEVISRNPDTRIVYNRSISVKRKRKQ